MKKNLYLFWRDLCICFGRIFVFVLAGSLCLFWRDLCISFGGIFVYVLAGSLYRFWQDIYICFGGIFVFVLAGSLYLFWRFSRKIKQITSSISILLIFRCFLTMTTSQELLLQAVHMLVANYNSFSHSLKRTELILTRHCGFVSCLLWRKRSVTCLLIQICWKLVLFLQF